MTENRVSQPEQASPLRDELWPVPEIDDAAVAFGDIKHLPEFDSLPEEFRRERHPFCDAVQGWFFSGAKGAPNGGVIIGDTTYTPKPGIDGRKALRAIKAALGSWEPKHEHKIAGCGFLFAQWFDVARGESSQ